MRAHCSQVSDPGNRIQITLSDLPSLGLTSQHPGISLLLLLLLLSLLLLLLLYLLQVKQLLPLLPQVGGISDIPRPVNEAGAGDSLALMMDGLCLRILGCRECGQLV